MSVLLSVGGRDQADQLVTVQVCGVFLSGVAAVDDVAAPLVGARVLLRGRVHSGHDDPPPRREEPGSHGIDLPLLQRVGVPDGHEIGHDGPLSLEVGSGHLDVIAGPFRAVRFLLLAVAASLTLTACGGGADAASSARSDADQAVCTSQSSDLTAVRALVDKLTAPDSRWAPGEASRAVQTAGDAVTALAGYLPDDEKLARAVDNARDGVQSFYDDLADDQTLEGNGQSADTAAAALQALAGACG